MKWRTSSVLGMNAMGWVYRNTWDIVLWLVILCVIVIGAVLMWKGIV